MCDYMECTTAFFHNSQSYVLVFGLHKFTTSYLCAGSRSLLRLYRNFELLWANRHTLYRTGPDQVMCTTSKPRGFLVGSSCVLQWSLTCKETLPGSKNRVVKGGSPHQLICIPTVRNEWNRSLFLKLWYAYRYWYANHCLLARDINKRRYMKKDKNS
jgi:hypothetical protein